MGFSRSVEQQRILALAAPFSPSFDRNVEWVVGVPEQYPMSKGQFVSSYDAAEIMMLVAGVALVVAIIFVT